MKRIGKVIEFGFVNNVVIGMEKWTQRAMLCLCFASSNRQGREALFVLPCMIFFVWRLLAIEHYLPCALCRVWRSFKLKKPPPVRTTHHATATQSVNDVL